MIDGHEFALCLTHDVDRPYKGLHHALYDAVRGRSLSPLRSLLAGENPYWQFEAIMELESELGVRSAFYFLSDPGLIAERPKTLFRLTNWTQYLGRYDPADEDIAAVIRDLDAGGWEVGLHGSVSSAIDPERLRREKFHLESVLGHSVRGGRQHNLRLSVPETWRSQAESGLEYDSTLGSTTDNGFEHGYDVLEPLSGTFTVFPLTLMEQTLPDPGTEPEAAWRVCADLLAEAAEHEAVMTVLWHPRLFNEAEFPGYRTLYRRLVEAALDAGAWVGPPAALLDRLDESSVRSVAVDPEW